MDLDAYVVGFDVGDDSGERNDLSYILESKGEERLQREEGWAGHGRTNKVEGAFSTKGEFNLL